MTTQTPNIVLKHGRVTNVTGKWFKNYNVFERNIDLITRNL